MSEIVRGPCTQEKQPSRTPASNRVLHRRCSCGKQTADGRECAECSARKGSLQRAARSPRGNEAENPGAALLVDQVLSSPGQALDASTRAFMERRFGYDFSQVRVHTGPAAAQSAQAIDAAAYTTGRDLVFNTGEYSPQTSAGRHLLAHELAHVVQQSTGAVSGRAAVGGMRVSDPNDAHERQADAVASSLSSDPISGNPGPAPTVYLAPLDAGASRAIQRQRRGDAPARPAVSRGAAIVEDGQRVAAGQMHRSEFLTALRDSLLAATNDELRRFGRTATDCPYILRTIERYAHRPLSSLMRLIRAFAHPAPGADAPGLIRAVTERARVVARRIAERQGPRAQAATERQDAVLPAHDPALVRTQLGNGRALEPATRDRMESSFRRDFASVRIHDDPTAARFSTVLGARAFTIGQDIAFAANQYRPGTAAGDLLIAHELAHTVQQAAGLAQPTSGPGGVELERQAERAGAAAVAGHGAGPASRGLGETPLQIQRWPAVVAGAIVVAEATPEIVVVAEVGAEVVITDGALVAAGEVAAPAVLEAAAPAVVETVAPAALETVAPAALETVAPAAASTSSSVLTAATATIGTGVAATTLSSDSPTQEDEQRRCRSTPCPQPLPIHWPAELPYPPEFVLVRTPSDVREAEGLGDRGRVQSRFAAEIADARSRHIPPPSPCDPMVEHDESRWNAPYDAHHIHPLYLGGLDVRTNICALEAHMHQSGHPRLDNQPNHLDEYMQCGICSASLKLHPAFQEYYIVGTK
ncbi:eCIS core domain-containing protein [Massilia horti]|uniref:DUF4157 domain-containing protein n=1 Tax=Massilia horti TaxID=2562153 RepID=A0A4Y9SY18_9BURK|nr:DUF4157 domain-containing protein [Massilia horti]TFW31749.1 DUF4157 domain-containing protein [Massilia horti]